MDVGAWLRALGLGQYETAFRESEIDAEVLPDLTEGDLSQLGLPLGHRKRLLKAIAGLGTGEPPAKSPSPAPASSSAAAERRPITVMFCDLVGSTNMAAKLDAEDWRTLVNSYLDEASAAVTGLGGHVLKKLGDGLMALFGYPHAQENDAERAVRAGLAIQRALVEINARNASKGGPELSARIGLDSGQVVVDATGEVFGDAPRPLRLDMAWRCAMDDRSAPSTSSRAPHWPPRAFPAPLVRLWWTTRQRRELSGLHWVVRCPRRLSGVRSGHEVRDIHSRRAAQ